jgi:hypothetical protein
VSLGRAIWGFVAVLIGFGCACGVGAPAAEASLSVPSPATFSGSSASGTPVPVALAAFEAAAGGSDNGTTPGEHGTGFRHVTWNGIAVDGSDPGSTVIVPGHVVAVSRGRLQPWGVELGPAVAVADDGFASVNSNADFSAISPDNMWAPFNSDTTALQIVDPAAPASTPVPALTRGLGVVFLNVETAGTTIQYYNGDTLLGQASAPQGRTSFVGLLFGEPVITRVVITLGTATIFDFDGSTATAGGQDPTGLVAAQDVVLAEPGAGAPTLSATAGVPVSAVLDGFTDTDPTATAADFTATIDWGDGTRSSGTIAPGSGGGFVVAGNHTYAEAGSYTAQVTVDDFDGSELTTQAFAQVARRSTFTSVSCSPSQVAVSAATTCIATVTDLGPSATSLPSGTVAFSSPTAAAVFAQATGCVLGPSQVTGQATCQVQFTPGRLPPRQARVDASYSGDGAHSASDASATVAVRPQRCTLQVLTKRLIRGSGGLALIVECDASTNVQITALGLVAPTRLYPAIRFTFGALKTSVSAGRPTVLVIKPGPSGLAAVRAAARLHRRVKLSLTLTASSNVTQTKTRARVVAAIRVV